MFTPEMLSFRRTVAGAVAGSGPYNADGDPPETPTHLIYFPQGTSSSNCIEIWDVTTPSAITKSASWNVGNGTYSHSTFRPGDRAACVKDGTAYFFADTSSKIWALDVSDPTTLGSSQIVGSISDTNLGIAILIAAHPTKDLLWVVTATGEVSTVDISNPASMSVIATVQSTETAPESATMSKDGQVCYLQDNGDFYRFELDGSNQPSNETIIDPGFGGAAGESLAWAENGSGDWFLVRGSSKNHLSIAEINSSYDVASAYTVTDATNYDRGLAAIGMPYVTNYTTDDLGVLLYERDDQGISIGTVDTSTDTITHRASVVDASYISLSMTAFDAFDNYIFTLYGSGQALGVFEWSALGTLTRIDEHSSTGTHTVATPANKMCLFKP